MPCAPRAYSNILARSPAPLIGIALAAALQGAACSRDEGSGAAPSTSAPTSPSAASTLDPNIPEAYIGRCGRLGPTAPAPAMAAFVSQLGTPARSRAALRKFAAPGVDVRPMRWTSFEEVDVECRYPGRDTLDCYQVRAIHDSTPSGYARWSRYEVCWGGDKIRRIEKLGGGPADGI
jgi:hypothetical protein